MELYYQLTATVLLAETIGLWVWFDVFGKEADGWKQMKNRFFLLGDLLTGLMLLAYLALSTYEWTRWPLVLMVAMEIITHYRRTSEYLLKVPSRYCKSKLMFTVNSFKLLLLFGLLFVLIPF